MKNTALKNDMREITTNKANISGVTTGHVNGKPSIEIIEREPKAYSSYLYSKVEDRDADLVNLNKILN